MGYKNIADRFHTFGRWKATIENRRAEDMLYVMKLPGRKNIGTNVVYVQLDSLKIMSMLELWLLL